MSEKKKENADKNKSFDELFIKDKTDPDLLDALWYSRDGNMDMYFMGYKNAAEILLKWFFEGNDDNGTIYPIIFLIRHTVELGLKESIRKAKLCGFKSNLVSEKNLAGIWKNHDLKELSRILEQLLESIKIGEYDDWNESKKFLDLWQDADPYATFGKYPSSTKGIPQEVKGTVSALKVTVMGMKIIDVLENILLKLDDNIDKANDK